MTKANKQRSRQSRSRSTESGLPSTKLPWLLHIICVLVSSVFNNCASYHFLVKPSLTHRVLSVHCLAYWLVVSVIVFLCHSTTDLKWPSSTSGSPLSSLVFRYQASMLSTCDCLSTPKHYRIYPGFSRRPVWFLLKLWFQSLFLYLSFPSDVWHRSSCRGFSPGSMCSGPNSHSLRWWEMMVSIYSILMMA